jgi:hypothetical protein
VEHCRAWNVVVLVTATFFLLCIVQDVLRQNCIRQGGSVCGNKTAHFTDAEQKRARGRGQGPSIPCRVMSSVT